MGSSWLACPHGRPPNPYVLFVCLVCLVCRSSINFILIYILCIFGGILRVMETRQASSWLRPNWSPSSVKIAKIPEIQINIKVLLLRHTENTKSTNSNKGVGDVTWLQASQLEAHLVCIVSRNATNANSNKGVAARSSTII